MDHVKSCVIHWLAKWVNEPLMFDWMPRDDGCDAPALFEEVFNNATYRVEHYTSFCVWLGLGSCTSEDAYRAYKVTEEKYPDKTYGLWAVARFAVPAPVVRWLHPRVVRWLRTTRIPANPAP